MPSAIPKNIHFFWGSCYLPEDALHSIISFLQHTDDSWKIILWTDNIKHITVSPIFKKTEEYALPSRVEIKEIDSLLDEGIAKLNQRYMQIKAETFASVLSGTIEESFPGDSFDFLKIFIHQLITGLAVPAAAKDCILPLALYCHGGYAFDLDAKAISTITPVPAKHRLLLLNEGKIAAGLAMRPNHDLAIYSFLWLRKWVTEKPFKFEPLDRKMTFFNLDVIKDRKNESRGQSICQTTGSMIISGFNIYCCQNHKRIKEINDPGFVTETAFPTRNGDTINMGVKFYLESDKSLWRKSKNPAHSYELDNADLPSSEIEHQDHLSI